MAWLLYIGIVGTINIIDLFTRYDDWKRISIPKLIYRQHLGFLLSLLGIFSGVMLIIGRKVGWFCSLLTLISIGGLAFFACLFSRPSMDNDDAGIYNGFIIPLTIILISIVPLIILLLKPFREKYKPTRKMWILLIVISILIFADELIVLWK